MNLILIDEKDRVDQTRARITGRAFLHARAVLGAALDTLRGEKLRVGIVDGRMGIARVVAESSDVLEVEFESWSEPPPAINLKLFIALPRPKVLPRVLQTAACLGIKEIHLLNSYRVEKKFWHCEQLRPERSDLALRLGLEQACDTRRPTIHVHRRLKPFVEDELPNLISGCTSLVAHPVATSPCPSLPGAPLALAVGPEGGFIPYEIDLFGAAGFAAVHLGPRLLKVETAVTALVTRLTFG